MSRSIDSTTVRDGSGWGRIEPIVMRFEAACRRRPWPRIEDYLDGDPAEDRGILLVELVHADLELRRRAGEPVRVEDYLERYPELARDAAVAGELMARDAELRGRASRTEPDDRGRAEPLRTLGRFELREVVGRGTFGTVYRARDTELDRVVAVKVPGPGHLDGEKEAARFLREARHAARLRHPGIVPVHEVGRIDGTCFLVSEFIEGTTLAERRARGPLAPRETAWIVARVADALGHAHGQGIIHRDIKPSNILLDSREDPYLTDFGLARHVDADATASADGRIRGTPAYMAPELVSAGDVRADVRGDIYSLGVVLYELLTGEVPFRGSLRMVLMQVLEEEPRPPRRCDESIPRDLETICLKAMDKEPSRRYPSAAAMADDLRRFLDDRPVRARPLGPAARALRWCRRRPRIAALAAATALAVLGMAWQWWRAEVHLAEATRQHRRYLGVLSSSGQVTASMLRIVDAQDDTGSIDEHARLRASLEQMNRKIALIREDPEARPALALACEQAGILMRRSGLTDAAIRSARQAAEAWDEHVSRNPDHTEALSGAAAAYCRLAGAFGEDLPAGERARLLERAGELYRAAGARLGSRHPPATRLGWRGRMNECSRMGRLARGLGRNDEAIAWWNEALACGERSRAANRPGDTPPLQSDLMLHSDLANLYIDTGRPADAIPHLIAWRDARAEELRADPHDPVTRRQLAEPCNKLGVARRGAGQHELALADFRQALEIWQGVPEDRSLRRFRRIAVLHVEIGRTEDRLGRFAPAIVSFRRAREIYATLARLYPTDPDQRRSLAMCDHAIANLLCDLDRFAEAADSFRRALELREALARQFPDRADLAKDRDGTRHRLAEVGDRLAGR